MALARAEGVCTVVAGMVFGSCVLTSAHEGFLTTYSSHVKKGEAGVMLLSDFTSPSRFRRAEGQRDYLSQMLEFKYNPTDQLALEWMVEGFEETGSGWDGEFTGFRYEGRYRLWKEKVPLNPMVYAEYENLDPKTRYKMEVSGWIDPPYRVEEASREPARERILESRLILTEDIGRLTFAANWINESDLDAGETAFGYACGVLWQLRDPGTDCKGLGGLAHPMALGFELFGALGDDRRVDLRPSRQEHYLQPSILFHAGEYAMVSLGFAIGLSTASDDLIRLNWGWRF